MEYYNSESKSLTLVTGVDGKKLETKTYQYPFFVKGIFTRKAIDLGAELEASEYAVSGDLFDRISNYIVELYGKQFTQEEVIDGIHQNSVVENYIAILMSVLQGDDSKNE